MKPRQRLTILLSGADEGRIFRICVVILAVKVSNGNNIYERKKGITTHLRERAEKKFSAPGRAHYI